jgi:hypothetical protein
MDGDAAETLVFQCDGCRRIVGDSYAWCGAYAELNAVSLQVEGPDVEVGTELLTSSASDCELRSECYSETAWPRSSACVLSQL